MLPATYPRVSLLFIPEIPEVNLRTGPEPQGGCQFDHGSGSGIWVLD
jgi:hypothetical protein